MIAFDTHWTIEMPCIVSRHDDLIPVRYKIIITLDVQTPDTYKQAIAVERLKMLFGNILSGAVFVNRTSDIAHFLTHYSTATVAEVWDEAWDQNIALLLFSKANAIMEGYVITSSFTLEPLTQDDHLSFTFDYEEVFSDLAQNEFDYEVDWKETLKPVGLTSPWYRRPDLTMNDTILEDEDEDDAPYIWMADHSWEHMGLGWRELSDDELKKELKGEVIDFPSRKRSFKPKIVE